MSTRTKSIARTEVTSIWLSMLLRSMRSRPVTWLMAIWLAGWAFWIWHIAHPGSWETAWGTLRSMRSTADLTWLHELGQWGQVALFTATGVLSLYVCYALWVWHRYTRHWMPTVREERLQGGCVLEVLIPAGSKAGARAAVDMYAQLSNLLGSLSHATRSGKSGGSGGSKAGFGKVAAERLALSLEMWSTSHTDGKVGFYIWCPRPAEQSQLVKEVRHLVMVYYPRCRVRWVEDPFEEALLKLGAAEHAGPDLPPVTLPRGAGAEPAGNDERRTGRGVATVLWYELGLLADSRYPISSGGSDERLLTGNRSGPGTARAGSPGAGSDPLATVIDLLGSGDASITSGENGVPLIGVQVVIAARPETTGQTQQAVRLELARLRELEAQSGKKVLGPQHEARVLALEEKADRQGYDVLIRLVAAANNDPVSMSSAKARIESLLRAYAQYNRTIAGVTQGFRVVRAARAPVMVSAAPAPSALPAVAGPGVRRYAWVRMVAPLLGRWHRDGISLPRMLPFMRMGRPCILNTAELSAIYHFPHQGLEGLPTIRWNIYRQIVPPTCAQVTAAHEAAGQRVSLGRADVDLPLLDLAKSGQTFEHTPGRTSGKTTVLPPGTSGVGTTPQDLRRGSYVFGPMGSGKSVFLYNIIVQYMTAGRGVGILDGKGDSYEEVLRLVPPHLEGEVLAFDPENRPRGHSGARGHSCAGGRSIGINPLDGRVVAQLGAEKVESLTMGLMRKMMGGAWEQAVLMQRFMRDASLAVLEVEPAPTMLNLWRWLQDDGKGGNEYREALVDKVRNQLVRDFWKHQVPGMSTQQRSSMQNVLTRVDRYVKNDVRYVILQPYSTVSFQQLMDRGTIFVGRVSPRLGEDQPFLGALVLNSFLMGAFARQSIPQEQRRDYLLVVDEFQNFVDTAKADVERMLSMARSYRLGLMLAHQFTEQLPKEVLSAILKNVQTWVLFGLQADDARLFAGYMGLRAEDFQNLPPYHTYQRTIVGNTQTGVYSARPLPPPPPAANPGERSVPGGEREARGERSRPEWTQDLLRSEGVPGEIAKLVHGTAGESEKARRARMLELARQLYWPAEEGDDSAVHILSMLNAPDLALYRLARTSVLDRQERQRILARPWLVPDKVERIHRLSALRWGTPCVEMDALVLAALRKNPVRAEKSAKGTTPYGKLARDS